MTSGAPLRIAHGFGNSRESARIALEDGVDVIEADVRLRANRLWLGHERRLPLLPILLGKRPLHPTPRAHSALSLGSWRARLDIDPLSLEELLATVAGRCGLLLDLKSPRRQSDVHRFVEILVGLLRRLDRAETARLCGDWPLLDEARRVAPECRVYYSVGDRRRWDALVRRLRRGDPIRGVSLHAGLLDRPTVDYLRDRGLEVFCWPVDDAAEAARVAKLGVDGIISSDLAILARTILPSGDERL